MEMRYVLLLLIACAGVLNLGCRNVASKPPAGHARRILYYHDPMHPSYRSDQPGIAPDCNMALTPVYADDSIQTPAGPGTPSAIRVNAGQAIAIGLSEARRAGKRMPKRKVS